MSRSPVAPAPSTLTPWHRAALALLESTALHLDPTLPGWAAIDDEAARCGDDPVLATAPTLAGLIEAALPRALAECYVTDAQVAALDEHLTRRITLGAYRATAATAARTVSL